MEDKKENIEELSEKQILIKIYKSLDSISTTLFIMMVIMLIKSCN